MHLKLSPGAILFGIATSQKRASIEQHNDKEEVQVWDGCFSQSACEKLHQTASQVGLSHKIFYRNGGGDDDDDATMNKLSQLEWALDSALTELGDDSNVVEYWCRQEWKHIEAHADVDERLAIEEQIYRYPRNGHVLYLQVGTEVRGPTCLFPGRKTGGDLATTDDGDGNSGIQLVTVPAVEGRLLRFEGCVLHAVPRPADLWLLPFTKYGPREPESKFGRSVVLFNTWPDNPPPRGVHVHVDDAGLLLDCDDLVQCEQYETWNKIPIRDEAPMVDADNGEDFVSKCKIWLLGDNPRRGYPDRTVRLQAPPDLKDVLEEPRNPVATWLRR